MNKKDLNHFVADSIIELTKFLDYWDKWNKINPELYPKYLEPEQWEEKFIEWQHDKLWNLN